MDDCDNVPQWKRELILRRRAAGAGNRSTKQLSGSARVVDCGSDALGCAGHQPTPPVTSCASGHSVAAASVSVGALLTGRCNNRDTCTGSRTAKMVQERPWVDNKQISVDMVTNGDKNLDSDSSEELQYGPGIVSKLKNRYLSLTLREQNAKVRPSILPLRKATSLEDLLDDDNDGPNGAAQNNRMFESRMNGTNGGNMKNVPNRYRNTTRGSDMKRARSVEAISRDHCYEPVVREDVFIIAKEGSDKPHRKVNADNQLYENAENKMFSCARINRPKRIAPVMNEREKPPADVVKQAKKIFEARPEMRTRQPQHTGEVAAKVASYKNIIIQTKVASKPAVKQKPVVPNEKPRKRPAARLPVVKPTWGEKSPDVTSPAVNGKPKFPDITSLIPDVSMINDSEPDKPPTSLLSETPDLILHSSPVHATLSPRSPNEDQPETTTNQKRISPESQENIALASSSVTFNFNNRNVSHSKVPTTQPLKLEINVPRPPPTISPLLLTNEARLPKSPNLSPREIEKNIINAARSQQEPKVGHVDEQELKCAVVPKPKRTLRAKQEPQNCVVFKFTDRKDVPDYIGNDGTVRSPKIELPKTGEGGITLLPGATIRHVVADEVEELLSLEGPPSPCDVSFINDNILIDGRSSLSKKTKKPKMRIQFVEAVPQIFEYPSESSLWVEEPQTSSTAISSSMGHTVPSLSGSSLANYTPKSGCSTDDFQLGVTKTVLPPPDPKPSEDSPDTAEPEEPVQFSSGTNSDILF